ncbi:MAG TPA: aspartate aminotransferase family protein [Spirochaetia bacterium]|nr:aspartate aminotransferase family protein [Spirochaetia bacterium]
MERKKSYVYDPPFPKSYSRELLIFDRGEGVYLVDEEGNRYLDFGAGIAVNALGYGREDLAETAAAQMRKLIHTSNLFTSEPTIKLAERLVALGGFAAAHFGNSGTEANEAALKYARLYAFRTRGAGHSKFLSFDSAFHGRTMGALSVTPNPTYQEPFEPLVPGVEVLPYNDPDKLAAALDSSYAGVIVEVIQGEGGLRTMSRAFAEALNETCRRHDVMLIADEVQTGLGRVGYPLASELFGLEPDIVTLAKPLGGGLPLSATLLPPKVNDLVQVGDHGSTFGGGPVTAAVSNRVLDTVLDAGFLMEVRKKAVLLEEGLQKILSSSGIVSELRGSGLLRGLVLSDRANLQVSDVVSAARAKGLVTLRSGKNVLRIAPPLVISHEQIAEGLSILTQVLSELEGK